MSFHIVAYKEVATWVKVHKVWSNACFPWMIVYVALVPRLLKTTSSRIIVDHILFVPQNQVIRWWYRFVVRGTYNSPPATVASGNIAEKELSRTGSQLVVSATESNGGEIEYCASVRGTDEEYGVCGARA